MRKEAIFHSIQLHATLLFDSCSNENDGKTCGSYFFQMGSKPLLDESVNCCLAKGAMLCVIIEAYELEQHLIQIGLLLGGLYSKYWKLLPKILLESSSSGNSTEFYIMYSSK